MVWIQLPFQLGLAERQRREDCLFPTFKMWGARSPPCLVPGNPSGFVDEADPLIVENPPASCCEEERAVWER